jgi:hypothetical protein
MKKIFTLLFVGFAYCSSAQIYPYIENFDSFTQFNPIGTQFGYKSDMSVYPRGISNTNCAQAQMSQFNHRDTILSPLIGPITANSEAFFYYRVVSYIGSVAADYTMASNENVIVQMGIDALNIYNTYYTINSSNQNVGTNFVRVTLNVTTFAGNPGNFKFIVNSPGNSDWYFHLDSVVVRNVTPPVTPIVLADTLSQPRCFDQCSGQIRITASGGTPPYNFEWSQGSTSNNPTGLCGGTYSVTVTDATPQTTTASYTLTEPTDITTSVTTTPILCFSDCTGSATVAASGGTPGYTFAWSNSSTSNPTQNLCSGNYSATITDANNCTVTTASTFIGQPTQVNALVDSAVVNQGNGATVTGTGGTPPFTFLWSDGVTTSQRTFANSDNYICTVCDANNCCDTVSVLVLASIGINDVASDAYFILSNTVSSTLFIRSTIELNLLVVNSLGETVREIAVKNGDNNYDVQALPAGMYYLVSSSSRTKSGKRFTKF